MDITAGGTNIRVLESTNDVYSVEVKQLIASCEILLTDQTQTPFFTPFLGKQLKWIHVTTAGVNLLMENLEFIVSNVLSLLRVIKILTSAVRLVEKHKRINNIVRTSANFSPVIVFGNNCFDFPNFSFANWKVTRRQSDEKWPFKLDSVRVYFAQNHFTPHSFRPRYDLHHNNENSSVKFFVLLKASHSNYQQLASKILILTQEMFLFTPILTNRDRTVSGHFTLLRFHPSDISHHRYFTPRTFHTTDILPQRHFTQRTFQPTDISLNGRFTQRTFHPDLKSSFNWRLF